MGKLAAAGIPHQKIAAVGEADSDAMKQSLFERMRNGSVRVLIDSTQKMGTGTNVQKRLVASHHLRPVRLYAAHTDLATAPSPVI